MFKVGDRVKLKNSRREGLVIKVDMNPLVRPRYPFRVRLNGDPDHQALWYPERELELA